MRNSIFVSAARGAWLSLVAAAALVGVSPALAQSMQEIDPDSAAGASDAVAPSGAYATPVGSEAGTIPALPAQPQATVPAEPRTPRLATETGATYKQDDLIGAAEGVFGKGAEGVARMIQNLLKKQGEPNGYIVGREAGGAFVVGLRYGSGTLFHKVEGQRPVYWTGPSVGWRIHT